MMTYLVMVGKKYLFDIKLQGSHYKHPTPMALLKIPVKKGLNKNHIIWRRRSYWRNVWLFFMQN